MSRLNMAYAYLPYDEVLSLHRQWVETDEPGYDTDKYPAGEKPAALLDTTAHINLHPDLTDRLLDMAQWAKGDDADGFVVLDEEDEEDLMDEFYDRPGPWSQVVKMRHLREALGRDDLIWRVF